MRNEKFDEKLLSAKVGDAAKLALRRGEPTFTRFLSEAERAYIERNVYYDRDEEKLLFSGGTDEAKYTVAGFFPAYLFYDDYSIRINTSLDLSTFCTLIQSLALFN